MAELTWEQAQENVAAWQLDPAASMLEFAAQMVVLTGHVVTVNDDGEYESRPVSSEHRDTYVRGLRAAAARHRAKRIHRHRAVRGHARSTLRAGRPRRRAARRVSGAPPGDGPGPDAPGRARPVAAHADLRKASRTPAVTRDACGRPERINPRRAKGGG